MIPYSRQLIDEDDIKAVVEVLRSDWLTTGPKVDEFERSIAEYVGTKEAVVVSSGTAALHSAIYAAGIGPGDEVLVPAMTFVASANCVVFQGGKPVFVDVEPDTLLVNTDILERKITSHTKAIIAVDYTGHPCDYDEIRSIANRYGLIFISDSCHSLGAKYKGKNVGSLADLNVFSFHPVKNITTGEGGAITTNDSNMAERMRVFRNHGITSDFRKREAMGSWFYEMVDLGYNYRITDIQCALGLSQLKKLPEWIKRRNEIASYYNHAFRELYGIEPLKVKSHVLHAYHLYVVKLNRKELQAKRDDFFSALRKEGIGVNVHYIPVHLHPFYKERFKTSSGDCPVAEEAYKKLISLPIYPKLTKDDLDSIIKTIKKNLKLFLET
jgi:perosamine synthetase